MNRFLTFIFFLQIIVNISYSQCNPENYKFPEVKSIFDNLAYESIDSCKFQFNIGSSSPDVDFMVETVYSCITKGEVLSLIQIYFNKCNQKSSEDSIIKKLTFLLDEGNYYIEVISSNYNIEGQTFSAYIYNNRIWIFLGDGLIY